MAEHASDAVEHARATFGVELDTSPESVGWLEAIATAIHQLLATEEQLSDDEFDVLCKIYGGYLGEVIRTAHGGEWEYEFESAPGVAVISLRHAKGRIFPPMKWARRIERGAEEDLLAFYRKISAAEGN